MVSVEVLLGASRSQRRHKGETTEQFLGRLTHLALEERNISDLTNLGLCRAALVVHLFSNVLTSTAGISACPRLTHLAVQDNALSSLDDLAALRSLATLHVSSNALTSLKGLEACTALEELYIQNQRVPATADPRPFALTSSVLAYLAPRLRVLNISGNNIRDPRPLSVLTALRSLDISSNAISSLDAVQDLAAELPVIGLLDVRGNPRLGRPLRYRRSLIVAAPTLTTLDGRDIKSNEREFALAWDASRASVSSRARRRRRLPSSTSTSLALEGSAPGSRSSSRPSPLTSNPLPRVLPGAHGGPTGAVVRLAGRVLAASKNGRRYVWIKNGYIGDRFCGLDENSKCDLEGYAFYVAGFVVPCIFMAIICLLAIPVFLLVRTCCACCCSGKSTYTRNTILVVKIGLAVCLVGVLFGFYFGYAGNKKASDGIKGLTRVAISTGENLVQRIDNIRRRIISASTAPPNADQNLQSAVDAGNDVIDTIRDIDTKVGTVNSYRFAAINIGFIFPSLFAFLSFTLGIGNLRFCWIHIFSAMFVLFALFFLWISTGLHWLIEILFSDLCFEARDFLFTPPAQRRTQNNPLEAVFHCSANDTSNPFRALATVINDGIDRAVSIACTALTEPTRTLPDGSEVGGICHLGLNCDNTGFPSVPCSEATLPSYQESTLYSERVGAPGAVISLLQCTQSSNPCVDGINKTVADTVYNSVNDVIIYRNILRGDVQPILECDFLNNLLSAINGVVCNDLVGGFGDIRKSQLSCSILFILAVVLMILGQKRFLALSQASNANGSPASIDDFDNEKDVELDALDGEQNLGNTGAVALARNPSYNGGHSLSDSSSYSADLPVYNAPALSGPPPAYNPDYDSMEMPGGDFDDFDAAAPAMNFDEKKKA
ncbi:uncharacterized protein AMSG_11898 [Thecamonas trahens ATCC 50062]|uniref:Uncharacterized protein n=1 Tax=Thecamonas trahens ATCC 50062 TaxID=461836 RepID=A0A0L0DBN0_THETB|nr:hypothetical protein AMSG_11898 [Thecamonas trahens ATCC 50062]KNC49635.1 hypothetical protein AMSG_11898 [Thecamonas trahens ATCC 50062]|eukprot:XP_013757772.1 hypothetical protein AMSG_11898 [Thecamonas trahens ATCC 50062]